MAYQISRLYDFQAGTRILSKQVDDELNQLVAALNNQDTRIDNILNTPVETVSAEEIIDARSGQLNLRARLDQLVTMDGLRTISLLTVGNRLTGSTVGTKSGAIGLNNTASGYASFAAGNLNEATAAAAIALGSQNHVTEAQAVAMGDRNHATGLASIALGYINTASGSKSVAIGSSNTASGVSANAFGLSLIAQGYHQTVLGRYNVASGTAGSFVNTEYAVIFGNGTATGSRANAFTMDWLGNFIFTGNHTFPVGKGPIVTTPDGTKQYRIGIDNAGAITTTLIT